MSDPSRQSTDESTGAGILLAGGVLLVLLLLLLLGFMTADRSGRSRTHAGAELTGQAGVVKMPTATPTSPSVGAAGGDGSAVVLLPGRKVASISADGRGTRVYATPSRQGLVMDLYRDGSAFEVLDPAGQNAGYPLEAEGFTWYRVRASDGLVGWVVVDRLVPLE